MTINPEIAACLAANEVTENGMPNRSWFEESCERSRRAIDLGRIESDRELQRILDGEYGTA